MCAQKIHVKTEALVRRKRQALLASSVNVLPVGLVTFASIVSNIRLLQSCCKCVYQFNSVRILWVSDHVTYGDSTLVQYVKYTYYMILTLNT